MSDRVIAVLVLAAVILAALCVARWQYLRVERWYRHEPGWSEMRAAVEALATGFASIAAAIERVGGAFRDFGQKWEAMK